MRDEFDQPYGLALTPGPDALAADADVGEREGFKQTVHYMHATKGLDRMVLQRMLGTEFTCCKRIYGKTATEYQRTKIRQSCGRARKQRQASVRASEQAEYAKGQRDIGASVCVVREPRCAETDRNVMRKSRWRARS